jgi:hypothetical protein
MEAIETLIMGDAAPNEKKTGKSQTPEKKAAKSNKTKNIKKAWKNKTTQKANKKR